jgi:hypothetical protein
MLGLRVRVRKRKWGIINRMKIGVRSLELKSKNLQGAGCEWVGGLLLLLGTKKMNQLTREK